jgi:hypothetical protein
MATIDSHPVIRQLLENNGYYETDPQVASIWSYDNNWGGSSVAVYWGSYQLQESEWVSNPTLLWSRFNGLTPAGKQWLETHKGE